MALQFQRIRQRRRRVALDQTQLDGEVSGVSNSASCVDRARDSTQPYGRGARRNRQFRTTDLIPKRGWSVTAVIALLLAVVAGLNLLHLHAPDWHTVIGSEGVAALSLDSGRGLSVWYSNFLLLLTSCVSVQLYLLRQHRRDDYRGSYRVWLWLAILFLLASVASVSQISELLRQLANATLGLSSMAGGSLPWMLVVKLVLLLLLLVRGLLEVRFSHLALIGLVIVVAAYAGAAVIHEVPQVQVQSEHYVHSARANLLLLAHTALFVSVMGFARFVYLEANGIVRRESTVSNQPKKESSERPRAKRKKKSTQEALKSTKDERKHRRSQAAKTEFDESQVPSESQSQRKKKSRRARKKVRRASEQPADQMRQSGAASARSGSESKSTESGNGSSKSNPELTARDRELMQLSDEEAGQLSKSERRRLRKLKKRTQRQAA